MATQIKDHLKPTFSLFGAKRRSRFPAPRSSGPRFLTSKGFTLIEILIALVVLAMGITLLITMFTVGMKGVIANQARTQATNLAQDLMDEIMGKNWDKNTDGTAVIPADLGPDIGEDVRSKYDDVDDYSNWSRTPPEDVLGSSLGTAYQNFTRKVSVFYVNVADLNNEVSYSGDNVVKRIRVRVSHSDISDVDLISLKTKSVY